MRNPGSKVVDAASLGADAPVRAGLGAGALTLLVVGSMIGSGIFSLPQTLSSRASPAGVLAGWAVSILGMLSIVLVFRNLSRRRADIGDGIFGYARTGFGHDMGFNAAWGHGVADAAGNGAYRVLIFSALGAFRPLAFFGEGNTLPALLASSVLLWTVTALVLRGVRVSARANNIVTCAKIVPLALCIVAALAAFDPTVFSRDFTGEGRGLSMFDQVRGVMMITTWVFIGCESATIFASRARSLDDVARASVYGFLIAALLRVAVSTLSLGVIPSREAARLHNPSLAGVLERMVGAWGGALVNACLILTDLGALLAWVMLCSEYLYLAGRGRVTDPRLAALNRHGAPRNALLLTSSITQLMVILACVYQAGHLALLSFATSLVLLPYLLTALFQLRLALNHTQATAISAPARAIGCPIWRRGCWQRGSASG